MAQLCGVCLEEFNRNEGNTLLKHRLSSSGAAPNSYLSNLTGEKLPPLPEMQKQISVS